MAEIMKKFNAMPLPMAIDRQNPIAVDSTTVWYDYDALVAYAASGATAYVGQLVVYVDEENDKSTAYLIQNDGTLSEVGSGSAASNVDGMSLELVDGTIGLYGYGKEYYKYNSAQGTEGEEGYVPAGYTLTTGWIAGLEPRVVEDEGKFVLGWYEPNTDTMEGLNTTVGTLGTKVDNLATDVADLETILNGSEEGAEEQVVGLVTRVDNLESTVKNLTSAFVFKGEVATTADLDDINNPQNGWVYKVASTGAEHVYDGSKWIELGTVYDVDLTEYAKKTDLTAYATKAELDEATGNLVTESDFSALVKRVGELENDTAISDLESTVADLEELVGTPAGENKEATGLYKTIGDLTYVAKIKIGETVLEPDEDHQVELSVFSNSAAGLVPVAQAEGLVTENATTYFLNAAGAWAIPVDARIGSLTYKDEEYSTVEQYIEAYVADHGMVWEPI